MSNDMTAANLQKENARVQQDYVDMKIRKQCLSMALAGILPELPKEIDVRDVIEVADRYFQYIKTGKNK